MYRVCCRYYVPGMLQPPCLHTPTTKLAVTRKKTNLFGVVSVIKKHTSEGQTRIVVSAYFSHGPPFSFDHRARHISFTKKLRQNNVRHAHSQGLLSRPTIVGVHVYYYLCSCLHSSGTRTFNRRLLLAEASRHTRTF